MKRTDFEMIMNELSHIKFTTEGAIKALNLNLKYIEAIEYKVKKSIENKLLIASITQPIVNHSGPKNQPSDLIKIKEVIRMTSLSRSTIYSKMNKQSFPQSISLGYRSIAWLRKDIEDWVTQRISSMWIEYPHTAK
jgi:prophage regulatory protein